MTLLADAVTMLIIADYMIGRDLTFTLGGYQFGFMDAEHTFSGEVTLLFLGPLGGYYPVPCSAIQGWTITALLLSLLLTGLAWLSLRGRRGRGESPEK